MTATLKRFRVQHFRSVNDSGWIETDNLTALIGTNEAGKTNLLLPLWKLKPANNESIDPLMDYPRQNYSTYKSEGDDMPFISADFELDDIQAQSLSSELHVQEKHLRRIRCVRYWDTEYSLTLLDFEEKLFDGAAFSDFLKNRFQVVGEIKEFEGAKEINARINTTIKESKGWSENIIEQNIRSFLESLNAIEYSGEESQTKPLESILNDINEILKIISNEGDLEGKLHEKIYNYVPSFVYYSDYGNLNSEIYLPRVIEDMGRKDLKGIERDKARTLKVLFDFVTLSPKEILELGNEQIYIQNKSTDFITGEARRKKEREVLLFSASTKMTKEFKEWWKQGDYKFRFQADGNHFRIWVSDDKRPEEIELESRSRGLQWFFSFFLVFLVESQDEHSGCVLLLDEPGVTLHPSAQEDLIEFFESLTRNNQVIYTTHSPFLIDSSNLGSVKAVYVDEKGYSAVSTDLRRNSKIAEKSVYPAHAAVGLSISETFLNGCQPVLVEGVSDQIYLHAVKTYLIRKGVIKPDKEIVFIPTGGIKGMKPIINIISSKEAILPVVVLDSDETGLKMSKGLKENLYKSENKKVLDVSTYVGYDNCEIEDLIPKDVLTESFDKRFRIDEYALADDIIDKKPFLEQAEIYFERHEISFENGWKVDLAKDIVKRIPKKNISEDVEKTWIALFKEIIKQGTNK